MSIEYHSVELVTRIVAKIASVEIGKIQPFTRLCNFNFDSKDCLQVRKDIASTTLFNIDVNLISISTHSSIQEIADSLDNAIEAIP